MWYHTKRHHVKSSRKTPRNKWKESDDETLSSEEDDGSNKRVRKSVDLQQAKNNSKKDSSKINLIDKGDSGNFSE